jgi:hypothetical protein
MGAIQDKLDALQAEIERLKAAQPTPIDHAAAARWKDEQHASAERRAAAYNPFTRSQLAEMQAAAPDNVCAGIVRDNRAVPGRRSALPPSQQLSNGRDSEPPSNTTGWRDAIPIGPQPGIQHVDRLLDEADRRDRLALVQEEARRRALEKAVEKPE